MSRSTIPFFPIAAWAFIVGAGVFALAKHEATPGSGPDIHFAVPRAAAMASDKMTLVMFVHPGCPCSVASLEELSALMALGGNRLHASVEIFRSSREPDKWAEASIWRSASKIPGMVVRADVDAVLARKCGAQTSGQVFLYDKSGGLMFQGGITGSRGHVGDNDGLNALTDIVCGNAPAEARPAHAPVFGCAIYSSANGVTASPLTGAPNDR